MGALRSVANGLLRLVRLAARGAQEGWQRVRRGVGYLSRHRLPFVAYGLFSAIILGGVTSLVLKHVTNLDFLEDSSSFALVLTLAFLVLYTYYTRQLARSDYEAIAGFWLTASDAKPDTVLFMIHNHCKRPLDCWSTVEVTVGGQSFKLRGFYGGEYPFFVQPHQTANSNLSIERDVVTHGGFSSRDLVRLEKEASRIPIHLKISFGYGAAGEDTTWLPPAYYYYSLAQQKLVLDVGAAQRTKSGIEL